MPNPNLQQNAEQEEKTLSLGDKLSDFLSVFYSDHREKIRLRFFGPHSAPENEARFNVQKYSTTREDLKTDESLLEHYRTLNETRGAYFIVNAGGDKDKEIIRYNAFFAEMDDIPLAEQHAKFDAAPVKSTIQLETLKSVHGYFPISGACTEAEWREVQLRLIAYFDSDPRIKNPSRVMRLPHFNHVAYYDGQLSYKRVQLVKFNPSERFTVKQMLNAFPPLPELKPKAQYEPSNRAEDDGEYYSWESLNAALRRWIMDRAKRTEGGNYEMACPAHNGKGETSLFLNPDTGAMSCLAKCLHGDVLLAAGLPARPLQKEIYSGAARAKVEREAKETTAVEEEEVPLPKESEHLSDLGNARRMVNLHGRDLHYCYAWNKFLVWDGRRWQLNNTGEAERRAKSTVNSIYTEAAYATDDEARKALARHALKSESDTRLKALLSQVQSEPSVPVTPDELDSNTFFLTVRNGTLNLRTGQLLPHRRFDLITKLAPVEFNSNATCPIWETFLKTIMAGKVGLISFLRRAVGYSLTGDTSERAMFIMYGSGANGKSTTLETLRTLLGDYATRTPTETLLAKRENSIPNDVAKLKGARFVSASETEEGKRLAEAQIKDLTGGDTISARFMRAEWFDFKPECKVWLSTNHKPVVRGTDRAIWDRLKLIPFDVRIPESQQDKKLLAKLQSELPGILAWAVRGCLEWQSEGLGVPDEVKSATEAYRSEMDVLAAFISDCCTLDTNLYAQATTLYQAYKRWCEDNGERPKSQRFFGANLAERNFDRRRSGEKGSYVWYGIGLNN